LYHSSKIFTSHTQQINGNDHVDLLFGLLIKTQNNQIFLDLWQKECRLLAIISLLSQPTSVYRSFYTLQLMSRRKNNPVVLCVDDDVAVLQAIRSLLEKTMAGQVDIEVAEGGPEALDACADMEEDGRPVSIIISDYIMPNMRGDELLIKLHELYPKMMKVMLTGQSDLTGVRRVINKASLYRFLEKPFINADLVLTVKSGVESFMAERALAMQIEELTIQNQALQAELEQAKKRLHG
jgi:FixJ family two-component response regulator